LVSERGGVYFPEVLECPMLVKRSGSGRLVGGPRRNSLQAVATKGVRADEEGPETLTEWVRVHKLACYRDHVTHFVLVVRDLQLAR